MPAVCERLMEVAPAADLARRLSLVFEALPRDSQTSISQAKLKAMQATAGSQLFRDRGQWYEVRGQRSEVGRYQRSEVRASGRGQISLVKSQLSEIRGQR